MKYIAITLILAVHFPAFTQKMDNELVLTSDSDTSFYQYHQERMNAFELLDLRTESSEFIFRSWDPVGVLTVKKADNEVTAEILFRVTEAVEDKPQPKSFTKIYTLPSEKAKLLYDLIINDRIMEIPSDKFIKDWRQGFDGITYTFETKSNESYSIKHYWTPSSQNGVYEAKQVIKFNEKLNIVGELDQYGEMFGNQNPFSVYTHYGVSYSVAIIKSKEEIKKEKREKRKARKNKR